MLIELVGTVLFLASVVGALGVVIALVYGALTRRRRLIRVLLLSRWLVKCDKIGVRPLCVRERSPGDAQTAEAHPTDHRGD